MEIDIVAKDTESDDFIRFVEECKRHGFKQVQEAGGIHFSYAKLKGERWNNIETGDRQSNIPVVVNCTTCKFTGAKFTKQKCDSCSVDYNKHEHK